MLPINVKQYSRKSNNTNKIISLTKSVCPVCLKDLIARIVKQDEKIYLEKDCIEHGVFSVLISEHAADYQMLKEYYEYFIPKPIKQKEYYLNITTRCNLRCPVCYLDYYDEVIEMNETAVKNAAAMHEVKRFTFSHGEPTSSACLIRNIEILKKTGKKVNMHTNALKLADYKYAKSLKDAGIDHISVQFDGFNEQAHKKIRGADVERLKLKALENLKRLSIPVTLNSTVSKNINIKEIGSLLYYAAKERFIKDISFITYSHYRADNLGMENYIMPDEVLDLLIEQSMGLVSREEVIDFQKAFFAYLKIFEKRKCFYYYHYFLVRDKNKMRPISDYIDLKKILGFLDAIKNENQQLKKLNFLFIILKSFKWRAWTLLPGELFNFLRGGYPKSPGKLLSITLATICDPYKYDQCIASNCGQGIIADKYRYDSYGTFLVKNLRRIKEE